jgi:hypothetical protein
MRREALETIALQDAAGAEILADELFFGKAIVEGAV